jgi:hypothetical protein
MIKALKKLEIKGSHIIIIEAVSSAMLTWWT